jgi:hypothetical protein
MASKVFNGIAWLLAFPAALFFVAVLGTAWSILNGPTESTWDQVLQYAETALLLGGLSSIFQFIGRRVDPSRRTAADGTTQRSASVPARTDDES